MGNDKEEISRLTSIDSCCSYCQLLYLGPYNMRFIYLFIYLFLPDADIREQENSKTYYRLNVVIKYL